MTPQERGRKGGLAVFQKYGSAHMSKIGHSGYMTTVWKMSDIFHHLGGEATAKLYSYTDPVTGEVGIEALRKTGWQPRKQHRYLGSCSCCKK